MFKINNRHSHTLAKNILNKFTGNISVKSNLEGVHTRWLINKNFSSRNFATINLNFFRKILKIKKGELILHPELSSKIDNTGANIGEKYKIYEDAEIEASNDFTQDEDLDFIKLDKNGVPIIKRNFYESLGVDQTASSKVIKRNFLKIAKKYHPDKHAESLVKYY